MGVESSFGVSLSASASETLAPVMNFFSDVLQFAEALWIMGRLRDRQRPAMLLGAWEHWKGRSASWRTYIAIFLVFGFGAATFQTWRQERSMFVATEKSRNRWQLKTYYVEAQEQQMALVKAQSASPQEYEAAKQDAEKWANDMGHWAAENMGGPTYVRLMKVPEGRAAGLRRRTATARD